KLFVFSLTSVAFIFKNRPLNHSLLNRKQNRHFGTKAQILRPLPHIENERGLALPRLFRFQSKHHVLHLLPAQFLARWMLALTRPMQPAFLGIFIGSNDLRPFQTQGVSYSRLVEHSDQNDRVLSRD